MTLGCKVHFQSPGVRSIRLEDAGAAARAAPVMGRRMRPLLHTQWRGKRMERPDTDTTAHKLLNPSHFYKENIFPIRNIWIARNARVEGAIGRRRSGVCRLRTKTPPLRPGFK
ncbi:hypothetical protein AZ78_4503 [Lysobacter capsici AZ78]|uniref:Uncharacterized protein n=1 Tax=Lysobacter capsici AZ78 TaxID=1444315 RepID=A0A108UD02_9GAMM|nr:hypothetical protein AZ78_4503 [Lysobacter capsici AZ78]